MIHHFGSALHTSYLFIFFSIFYSSSTIFPSSSPLLPLRSSVPPFLLPNAASFRLIYAVICAQPQEAVNHSAAAFCMARDASTGGDVAVVMNNTSCSYRRASTKRASVDASGPTWSAAALAPLAPLARLQLAINQPLRMEAGSAPGLAGSRATR